MKLKPIKDRILVEPLIPAEVTESGIMLIKFRKELPEQGRVIAIGNKVREVQVGDQILFHRLGYLGKVNNGIEYLLINEKAVYAILEEKE